MRKAKKLNEKVVCADGFTMSVQANETAYCEPRIDNADTYTEVEVGFPSCYEPLLMQWIEGTKAEATETVYGYVPSQQIALICAKHGGIVSGELPAGVAYIEVKDESR